MSRNRLLTVATASAILFGVSFGSDASAFAQWSAVGSPQRPSWVDVSAERRLRMLSALPAMKNDLRLKANAYIGSQGPGLAVGLVLDDGLYYNESFGFADAQRKQPPDENTIFRAGSLSKVITGTALLTLIDDPARQMSLNDLADANRYLPELKFVCPNFNQSCQRGSQNLGIKLSHLVSHTSGLANVMETTNAHTPAWLSDLKKSWLLFTPGAFGAYSGVGVEGVGLIEQRVSGQSYVDFVSKNLFAPLGMHLSLDKILYGSEINNLRNFLKPAFCYEFNPCLAFCSLGLASSFGCFALARAC